MCSQQLQLPASFRYPFKIDLALGELKQITEIRDHKILNVILGYYRNYYL